VQAKKSYNLEFKDHNIQITTNN